MTTTNPSDHPRPSIVALVPMRHDSERVRGKNYRPLGDRPLFHHIVETLLSCEHIDKIAINTDSSVIAADVARTFPEVMVIERPASLRGGSVPMNDVLLHDVSQISADYFVQTHSTNPFLRPETVTRAIERFLDAGEQYDSLFSVTPLQTRLWTTDGKPINHDPSVLLRTQDLPPVLEENSCLYVFTASGLAERGNRIGERPLLFQMDPLEAWDIDEEFDWRVAELLYADRGSRAKDSQP